MSDSAILREALRAIAQGDYPRTVADQWFSHARKSEADMCPHDYFFAEHCYECAAEYAASVLDGEADANK